jgi:putative RNA 2'-phosphotransferase
MKAYSKLLSYILRHAPHEFGLRMDRAGWVETEALLGALVDRDDA